MTTSSGPASTTALSWDALSKMESAYGDAFYLLDCEAFRQNYLQFLEAFRSIYPNTQIAYSYKTNYTPHLCRLVNEMGGYAEVVSRLEYDLALQLGVDAHRIIFNGPYKTRSDLERAFVAGSIVNIDSPYELALIESIARRLPTYRLQVGLRCNFPLDDSVPEDVDRVSRFGLDVAGGELNAAARSLSRLGNCVIAGLHCHFSTSHKSVESYAFRTSRMLALASSLFDKERQPSFFDVGGGFFGKMPLSLQSQFPVHVPTYREYASAIAARMADRYAGGAGPELIIEPGTALTGDVMKFVAKVMTTRRIRSRAIAVSSGSVYDIKPTLHKKNLPLQVFSRTSPADVAGPFDIVGYTCMEHDCLYEDYNGALAATDYLVFDNVGAYSLVLKPPFIRASRPIVAYNSQAGSHELIKREETFADVFATFSF